MGTRFRAPPWDSPTREGVCLRGVAREQMPHAGGARYGAGASATGLTGPGSCCLHERTRCKHKIMPQLVMLLNDKSSWASAWGVSAAHPSNVFRFLPGATGTAPTLTGDVVERQVEQGQGLGVPVGRDGGLVQVVARDVEGQRGDEACRGNRGARK